jgi:hypothetical protein
MMDVTSAWYRAEAHDLPVFSGDTQLGFGNADSNDGLSSLWEIQAAGRVNSKSPARYTNTAANRLVGQAGQ